MTSALARPITLSSASHKSIRHIARDLVGMHSTEIAMRIREGMLSRNLRMALKYLQFVTAYNDGKPIETHRMVGLVDGPGGQYDVGKLDVDERKALLELLRKSKDRTIQNGAGEQARVADLEEVVDADLERRKTENRPRPKLLKGKRA